MPFYSNTCGACCDVCIPLSVVLYFLLILIISRHRFPSFILKLTAATELWHEDINYSFFSKNPNRKCIALCPIPSFKKQFTSLRCGPFQDLVDILKIQLAVALFAIDQSIKIYGYGPYFITIDHPSIDGDSLARFLVID